MAHLCTHSKNIYGERCAIHTPLDFGDTSENKGDKKNPLIVELTYLMKQL